MFLNETSSLEAASLNGTSLNESLPDERLPDERLIESVFNASLSGARGSNNSSRKFSPKKVFRIPVLAVCAIAISSLSISSCTLSGVTLWQSSDSTTAGVETKQGKKGSFGGERALNASYFSSLLQREGTRSAPGELLRLVILSNKPKEFNGMGDALGLAVNLKGEVFLVGANGLLVPWLPAAVSEPLAVAISIPAGLMAIADVKGVNLIDLVTGKVRSRLTRVKTRINSLDFDQQGEALLVGGTDTRVYRWKFLQDDGAASIQKREQSLERYIGHATIVSQVRFHPKGRVFFSADWSGKVAAWVRYDADAFEGEYLTNAMIGRPFTSESLRVKAAFQAAGNVESLEGSADGELLAVASDEGQLSLLLVRGFRSLVTIPAHRGLIYDIGFRADGREIVTVGRDDRLRLWSVDSLDLNSFDPTTAKLNLAAEMVLPGVRRVAISADGRIIVGFKSGELQVLQRDQLPLIVAAPPVTTEQGI